MRVVIVYESCFGNTHEVAEAIQDGIRSAMPHAQVSCLRAAEATRDAALGADLLVVGGPTHAHGMTSAVTRKMGLRAEDKVPAMAPGHQADRRAASPGVREWFHGLPRAPMGSLGAAFDTRGEVRMAGGAANGIARRLRHRRYELVSPPTGFIVEDVEGPVRPGELERARSWGAGLLR